MNSRLLRHSTSRLSHRRLARRQREKDYRRLLLDRLEPREMLIATPARFDFGTATSALETDYTRITNTTAYSATPGYGWSSTTNLTSSDTGNPSTDSIRRDYVRGTTATTFLADVENGQYDVTVTLGASSSTQTNIRLQLEGATVDTLGTVLDQYFTDTYRVTVSDGQLTFEIEDLDASSKAWYVNALTIVAASDPTPPAPLASLKVDFGTAASALESGYVRAHRFTLYDPMQQYGWDRWSMTYDAVASSPAGDSLRSDYVRNAGAGTFFADMANGQYDVTVTLGVYNNDLDNIRLQLEGATVDNVGTINGQFYTNTYRVTVSDGQLTFVIEDLDTSSKLWYLDALTILPASDPTPPAPLTSLNVDFGTATSALETGYVRAHQFSLYDPMQQYGWDRWNPTVEKDSGNPSGDSLRRDHIRSAGASTFLADMANGQYDVTVTLGVYNSDQENIRLQLEGVTVDNVTTILGQFYTNTYRVTVSDGQLTFMIEDLDSSGKAWYLDALTILPASDPTPPAPLTALNIDFGTATSALESGYVRAHQFTLYDPVQQYGWDRWNPTVEKDSGSPSGDSLRRDHIRSAGASTFLVDVANGEYDVSFVMGVYNTSQTNIQLKLEGTAVATFSTTSGQYYTNTFQVTVSDGQLTIDIDDLDSSSKAWYLNAVTIVAVGNTAPTANDDTHSIGEDSLLSVSAAGVLANDTDPNAGDTLTVTTTTATSSQGAAVVFQANGSFTYDPRSVAALQGLRAGQSTVDNVSYAINDGHGGTDTAVVTITVNGANDAPTVASPPGNQSVNEDATPSTFNLAQIFADADVGDGITYSVIQNTNVGLVSTGISGGTLTLTYAANQFGTAQLTLRATDTAGSYAETSFQVTVNSVNDPPVTVNPIGNVTVDEDAADTTIDISNVFGDFEIAAEGDSLTYDVIIFTNAAGIEPSLAGTTLTIHYPANHNGTAFIGARATDSRGGQTTSWFNVTINATSDLPTVLDELDDLTVAENDPDTSISLWSVFYDPDVVWGSDYLTFTVNPTEVSNLVTANIQSGNLILHYLDNSYGEAEFTVRATDSTGQWVESSFHLTVQQGPPTPEIQGTASVPEGSTYTLSLDSDEAEGTWTINWNDGSSPQTFTHTAISATHVYADGYSEHTIVATFDDGTAVHAPPEIEVAVLDVAPTISVTSAEEADEGTPYTLTISVTDPGDDPVASWQVNWGDGTVENFSGPIVPVQHTFADGNAAESVIVTVTNGDGSYSSGSSTPAGNLVPSFADDGIGLYHPDTGDWHWITGSAAQSDGKVLVFGLGAAGNELIRVLPDGSMDTEFGDDGLVLLPGYGMPRSIVTLDDGRLVVISSGSAIDVVALTSSGEIDTTFDGSWFAAASASWSPYFAQAIRQGDGKILIVASDFNGSIHLMRANPNGSADTTFSVDGIVTTTAHGSGGSNYSIALDADERIVVSGNSVLAGSSAFFVCRFLADGNVDTNFGDSGQVRLSGFGDSSTQTMVTSGNGIYVASTIMGTQTVVAHLLSDGTLDNTFGSEGIADLDIALNSYEGSQTLLTGLSGELYLLVSANNGFVLARLTASGDFDSTFSDEGRCFVDFTSWTDTDPFLALSPDGDVYVIGKSLADNGWNDYGIALISSGLRGHTLEINDVAPILTIAGNTQVAPGSTYSIDLSASDPGDDTLSGWTIDWGDGTSSNVAGNVTMASHTYGTIGVFQVTASATDEDGTYDAERLGGGESLAVTVDRAPTVANAISTQEVSEDAADLLFDLTSLFADDDLAGFGDVLAYSVVGNTNAALVTATIESDQVRLHLAANQHGSVQITLRATDSLGLFVETSFTLDVAAVNDAPYVAQPPGAITRDEDSAPYALNVNNLFGDVDAIDGDALTLTVSTVGSSLVTLSLVSGVLTITPLANANGTAPITLRVTDAAGAYVETSFDFTLTPVNDAPTLLAPIADISTYEDAPATQIDISQIFHDIDLGDSLTYSLVANTNTSLVFPTFIGQTLSLAYLADQHGSAAITLRATDSAGAYVETSFEIDVAGVYDAPRVLGMPDQHFTGTPNQIVLNMQTVFFDPDGATDGETLTWQVVGNTNFTLVSAYVGTVDLNLWLTAGSTGSSLITLQAIDSSGLVAETTFVVSVVPENRPPELTAGSFDLEMFAGEATRSFDLRELFSDLDIALGLDSLTFELVGVSNPSPQDPIIQATLNGTIVHVNTLPGKTGSASITVAANDQFNGRVERTLQVNVAQDMPPPRLVSFLGDVVLDEDFGFHDVVVTGGFYTPAGATLDYSVEIAGLNGDGVIPFEHSMADGTVTFTSKANEFGRARVTIIATCDSGTVWDSFVVEVRPVNDSPVPSGNSVNSPRSDDAPFEIDLALLFADYEVNHGGFERGETLTYAVGGTSVSASLGDVAYVVRVGNTLKVYPRPNRTENTIRLTVTATDPQGASASRDLEIELPEASETESPSNGLPKLTEPALVSLEVGQILSKTFTATGQDTGDTLTFQLVSGESGMAVDSQTGELTWTPTTAAANQVYQAIVAVTDGTVGYLHWVTQLIRVGLAPNQAPQFVPLVDDDPNDGQKKFTIDEGETLQFRLYAEDYDNWNTVTYSFVNSAGTNATLTSDGLFSWQPSATEGRAEPYSFTVRATDNGTPSKSSDLIFSVIAENAIPVIPPLRLESSSISWGRVYSDGTIGSTAGATIGFWRFGGSSTVSFEFTSTPSLPPGLVPSISENVGLVSWHIDSFPAFASPTTYIISVTATDQATGQTESAQGSLQCAFEGRDPNDNVLGFITPSTFGSDVLMFPGQTISVAGANFFTGNAADNSASKILQIVNSGDLAHGTASVQSYEYGSNVHYTAGLQSPGTDIVRSTTTYNLPNNTVEGPNGIYYGPFSFTTGEIEHRFTVADVHPEIDADTNHDGVIDSRATKDHPWSDDGLENDASHPGLIAFRSAQGVAADQAPILPLRLSLDYGQGLDALAQFGLQDYEVTLSISHPERVQVFDGGTQIASATRTWILGTDWLSGARELQLRGIESGDVELTLELKTPGGQRVAELDALKVTIVQPFDLDIDSDNDNGLNDPSGSLAEDLAELGSGMLIVPQMGDADGDGIPDYADGMGTEGDQSSAAASDLPLVPLLLRIPDSVDLANSWVQLSYPELAPREVRQLGVALSDAITEESFAPGSPGSLANGLRLWTTNAATRDPQIATATGTGQYIAPGLYRLTDLTGGSTGSHLIRLYVEAVGTTGLKSITATLGGVDQFTSSLWGSGTAIGGTDQVNVSLASIDLDIDTNNNGIIAGNDEEARWEDTHEAGDAQHPGKWITINDGDTDGDLIPDFADFTYSVPGPAFAPLRLTIPAGLDLDTNYLTFHYSASNPSNVSQNGSYGPLTLYSPASGHLRLWLKDGMLSRSVLGAEANGDFLKSNVQVPLSKFPTAASGVITLYVEGIRATSSVASRQIKAVLSGSVPTSTDVSDTVSVSVIGVDLDIDSDNNNGLGLARSDTEDHIENRVLWVESVGANSPELPGKRVPHHVGDEDGDGIPNFADYHGDNGHDAGKHFTQIVVELPESFDPAQAKITFTYNAAALIPPGELANAGRTLYPLPTAGGSVRLWNLDGALDRNPWPLNASFGEAGTGNYVAPGIEYKWSELVSGPSTPTRTMTLYVEGVGLSTTWADVSIEVSVNPFGDPPPSSPGNDPPDGNSGYDTSGTRPTLAFTDLVRLTVEQTDFVRVSATNAYAMEGNDPATGAARDPGAFSVSRGEGNTSGTVRVEFDLSANAIYGSDFTLFSPDGVVTFAPSQGTLIQGSLIPGMMLLGTGWITIPDGFSAANVLVRPIDNAASEWDETVHIELKDLSPWYDTLPNYNDASLQQRKYQILPGFDLTSSDTFGVPFAKATLTIFDDDGVDGFINRNIDTLTTGLTRDTVGNGIVDVDLLSGQLNMAIQVGVHEFTPSYHGNDNLQPLLAVDWELPVAAEFAQSIAGMLSFTKIDSDPVTFALPTGLSGSGPFRFVLQGSDDIAQLLRTGHYEYDITFEVTVGGDVYHRAIRGSTEIINRIDGLIGDTEFGDRWWIDSLDRLVPGDGTSAGLSHRGLGSESGMALFRGDGTSAWYEATPKHYIVNDAPQLTGDWYVGTAAGGHFADYHYTYTGSASWQVSGLVPNRMVQVFAAWVPGPNRLEDVIYTISGTNVERVGQSPLLIPALTEDELEIHVNQRYIPSETIIDGTRWRSLGYFISDGTTLTITATGGSPLSPFEWVADAILVADDWNYQTPDGSYARLEHGTLENKPHFFEAQYGQFTLLGTHGERYEFDRVGAMTRVFDANGNQTKFEYADIDLDGLNDELIMVTQQGGLITHFNYDNQKLATIVDFAQRETWITIDNGKVTSIELPDPNIDGDDDFDANQLRELTTPIWTFNYDTVSGKLKSIADPLFNSQYPHAHITTIEYGPTGAVTKVTNGDGGLTSQTAATTGSQWHISAQLVGGLNKIQAPAAGSPQFPSGQPATSLVEAQALYTDGRETNWAYQIDRFGLTTAILSPKTVKTYLDSEGQPIEALPESTQKWERNKHGQVTRFTLPNGNRGFNNLSVPDTRKYEYEYDDRGNVETVRYPDNTFELWTFDLLTNQALTHANQLGHETQFRHDPLGNVTLQIDPSDQYTSGARRTKSEYTPSPFAPAGESPTQDPDVALAKPIGGQLDILTQAERTPDAVQTKFEYFGVGPHIGLLKKVTFAYDTAQAASLQHTYDAFRSPLTSQDELERETKFKYDRLGRLIKTTLPDPDGEGSGEEHAQQSPETRYFYDTLGNATRVTDPRGNATESTYDGLGRLSEIIYPVPGGFISQTPGEGTSQDRPRVEYRYDPNGNLVSSTDERGGVTTSTYDARNQLVKRQLPAPFGSQTSIDGIALPAAALAAPTVEFGYDVLGNLTFETNPRAIQVDNGANRNLAKTTYDYDALGRRIEATLPNTGPNPAPGLTDDGHPAPKLKFKYDAAGRLVESSSPGGSTDQNPVADRVTNFTYDVLGRQVKQEAPADSQNKRVATLTKYDLRDNVRTITISAPATIAGNQSLPAVELATTNFHDLRNRLVAIDHPGASPSEDGLVSFYSYSKAGELLGELTVADNAGLPLLGEPASLPLVMFNVIADSYAADPHRITRYETDSLGRVTKTIGTDADGPGGNSAVTTDYKYDAASNVVQTIVTATDAVTGALEQITDVEYDNLNRPWRTQGPAVTHTLLSGATAEVRPEAVVVYNVDGSTKAQLVKNVLPTESESSAVWLVSSVEYDGLGRPYKSTAPLVDDWSPTQYSFADAAGNVVLTVAPTHEGAIAQFDQTAYQYDPLDRRVSTTNLVALRDPNNPNPTAVRVLATQYNADGSVRRETNSQTGDAGETLYAYDSRGNLASVTQKNGDRPEVKTSYSYDAFGRRLSLTDPLNSVTRFEYDALGRQTAEVISRASATSLGGQIAAEFLAAGAGAPRREFRYDAFGNLVQAIDRELRTIEYDVDNFGRRTSEAWFATNDVEGVQSAADIPASLAESSFAVKVYHAGFQYTASGKLRGAYDEFDPDFPRNSDYRFEYDALLRNTSVEQTLRSNPFGDAVDVRFDYQYDLLGRRTRQKVSVAEDPYFTTDYTLDALARVTQLQQFGDEVAIKTVAFGYSGLRLEEIRRADGFSTAGDLAARTVYDYYADGRLQTLTNEVPSASASGVLDKFSFEYDSLGRQVARQWQHQKKIDTGTGVIYPTFNDWEWSGYDSLGQLTNVDRLDQVFIDGYDDPPLISIPYDANGNRIGIVDSYNRVLEDSQSRFLYDDEGNVTRHWRYAAGPSQTVNLSTESANGPGDTAILPIEAPGTVATHYRLRLASVTTDAVSPGTWSIVVSRNGTPLAQGVVNDWGRVVNGTESYWYPRNMEGSLDFSQVGTGDIEVDFFPPSQLVTGTGYSYVFMDSSTVKFAVDRLEEFQSYEWDFHNRLVEVRKAHVPPDSNHLGESLPVASTVVEYQYDVFGNRIAREVAHNGAYDDSASQFFAPEEGHALLEFGRGNGGALIPRSHNLYAQGVDRLLATETFDNNATTLPDAVIWALTDQQGSVTGLVSEGQPIRRFSYDSFGGELLTRLDTGSVFPATEPSNDGLAGIVHARYTGRETDPETGLYYYRARWYNADSGRFLSQDPMGFVAGDTNLYRYVGNSPANATDPSGNSATLVGAGIGFVGGFLAAGFSSERGFSWSRAWAGGTSGALIGAGIGLAIDTFGAGTPASMALIAAGTASGALIGAGVASAAGGGLFTSTADTNWSGYRTGMYRGAVIGGVSAFAATGMSLGLLAMVGNVAYAGVVCGALGAMYGDVVGQGTAMGFGWQDRYHPESTLFAGLLGGAGGLLGGPKISVPNSPAPALAVAGGPAVSSALSVSMRAGMLGLPAALTAPYQMSKSNSSSVPKKTSSGQIHHPIATKIGRELTRHPTLRGLYQTRDPRFTTQAIDGAAHRGYQTWHRQLDDEVVNWLKENRSVTPKQFERWLRWRYSQPDLKGRFPDGF